VARARRRWIRERGFIDPAHLVFIDETAVTTNMVRLNGWNPRGERLVSDAPMSHWEMVTFIAGLRQTGIVAPMPIKGAMNGEDLPGLHRAMFGPNTQFPTPSCRAAVKDGRHASGVVCCNASRPLLDRREHDGMLMCSGLESHRRKVTLECDR
jgi:hypothetical protein